MGSALDTHPVPDRTDRGSRGPGDGGVAGPDFSGLFRIKAGYLIAARAEDQLTLPTDQHDPLAAALAQIVYADLRADGLTTGPTAL